MEGSHALDILWRRWGTSLNVCNDNIGGMGRPTNTIRPQMKQDIIINATVGETRIALLEDNLLVELFVERPDVERMVGSLYKGVIRKVVPGMSAAFVDIGSSRDAFLHFSDVGGGNELVEVLRQGKIKDFPDSSSGRQRRVDPRSMRVGQEIIAQVTKEPIGHKGPRISSQVTLAGRFLVLVPHESYIGVSRKIAQSQERKRLRQTIDKLRPPGFGAIVRTVAEKKSEGVLMADVDRALKTWRKTENAIRQLNGPGLVYRDMTMASSVIRDLFNSDVNSLVLDSKRVHRELVNYVQDIAPNLVEKIKLHRDRMPIFDYYGIEKEIERSLSRKVWMNGGGYIFFDPTEALFSIDVNSGRFAGKKNHEDNALKINLQSVQEISRQLRLRDMGGIIVIDFIDMELEQNRKKVFTEMAAAMRTDRSKWDIAPISPFGLLEMTRQRIRPSLLSTFREVCHHCEGTGMIASMETVVTNIERWIRRFVAISRERRLTLTVHPEVKTYLTGGLKSRIARIMWSNRLFIALETDGNLKPDEFKGFSYKRKKDVTEMYMTERFNVGSQKNP